MNVNVGILHPGEMGVSVAVSARDSGHTVLWASEGRSPQTYTSARMTILSSMRAR